MLDNYTPYILNDTNISNYLKYTSNKVLPAVTVVTYPSSLTTVKAKVHPKVPVNVKIKTTTNDIFIPPNGSDTLFWCYFMIIHGEIEYEMCSKTQLFAMQTKIQYVDIIRKNKSVVKMYKFDTLTNIENNLANEPIINISTIFSLCAIHNLHVIVVMDKAYYELKSTSSNTSNSSACYIIYKLTGKYGFVLGTPDKIDTIYNTLYKMDHLHKPIKCISAYKVKELSDIAGRLNINLISLTTNKQKTKQELYTDIIQYF